MLAHWSPFAANGAFPLAWEIWLKSRIYPGHGAFPIRIVYVATYKRDKWRVLYGHGELTHVGGFRTSYDAMQALEHLAERHDVCCAV